jgi:hypothetical protein
MELQLQGDGSTTALYSNNYFNVPYTAANYTPEGEMHPCTELDGKKARISYAETADKSAAGEIISVELSR